MSQPDAAPDAPASPDADPAPERRVLLWIAFDGADFHGFQRQRDLRTVAGELEAAWLRFRGSPAEMRSSSRTDAGVHARRMPACFVTRDPLPVKGIRFGLDHELPADLAILDALEVPDDFHVRHDAVGKRYVYQLWTGRGRDPTRRRDHWHVPWQLDVAAMQRAAAAFEGEHDFAGYRTTACTAASTFRSLSAVRVSSEGRAVTVTVEGNAFLHNMVRIIVGTLVEVGKGRIDAGTLPARIASRRRDQAGPTAPGHGLRLDEVFYGAFGAREGLAHKDLLERLRAQR